MNLINIDLPHGPGWQLLAALVVIIIGPILAERVRIPGLIGLLIGGWLIGPNGIGIVPEGSGVVDELGDIGLLYLMFLAGLELDLGVFARYRKQAIGFALLTFSAPMALGTFTGFALGYSPGAAFLLGSLVASHTLITYPLVKRMGLAANRAVAIAVGATIVTDTLALMVLAVVSGSTLGSASGIELVVQLLIGLSVLLGWCFVVLPRVTKWFFTGVGQQRVLRYVYLIAALLSAAVISEMFSIEGIVGAFFAGLALNRYVPNESSFMERVEFFGAALFIPLFLVSVGTIIEPAVVIEPSTLALAGLFVAACLGGKIIAAVLCRPLFGFTWNETGVAFALTSPQAAGTLAATFVGLQIGLFTITVVNAVMLLIVVSLVVSSLAAARFGNKVPRPPLDTSRLGRSVVVHVTGPDCAPMTALAARLAQGDAGVVHPTVVVPTGTAAPDEDELAAIEARIARLGIDAEVEVRYDTSTTLGVAHAASGHHASLVVAPAGDDAWLPTLIGSPLHTLVASVEVPVMLVRPGDDAPWQRVILALGTAQIRQPGPATHLALEITARLAATGLQPVIVAAAMERVDDLLRTTPDLAGATRVDQARTAWLRSDCSANDVVILPGGNKDTIDTARASKAVTVNAGTVVIVADRRSVAPVERASAGISVLGTQLGGSRVAG